MVMVCVELYWKLNPPPGMTRKLSCRGVCYISGYSDVCDRKRMMARNSEVHELSRSHDTDTYFHSNDLWSLILGALHGQYKDFQVAREDY